MISYCSFFDLGVIILYEIDGYLGVLGDLDEIGEFF